LPDVHRKLFTLSITSSYPSLLYQVSLRASEGNSSGSLFEINLEDGRQLRWMVPPPPLPLFPPLVSFNAYLVTCIFYRFVTGEFTRVEGEQQRHTPRNQRRWRKAAAVDAFARRRTRDRLAAPAQRAFAPNLRPDPSTREGNGGKRWLHAKPGGGAYIFISIFGAPFFFLGRLGPNLEPATGVVCGMHGLRNG